MATPEQNIAPPDEYFAGFPDVGPPTNINMAHAIALGGLMTGPEHLRLYAPMLEHADSPLSSKDRYFHPPGRGLDPIEEMYGELEERLIVTAERLQSRVALIGHSLGGHFGFRLGLDHPELVESVTGLGAIPLGIDEMTPAGKVLRKVLKKAHGIEDVMHDSPYMQKLAHDAATLWSPDTSLHLIATPLDELAKYKDTLDVELPPGQSVEKRVVVVPVPIPGVSWVTRNVLRLPEMPDDAQPLYSAIPALHETLPLIPAVIHHNRQVRRAYGHEAQKVEINIRDTRRPKLTLVTA